MGKICRDIRRPLSPPKLGPTPNPVATLNSYRDIGPKSLYRDREGLYPDLNHQVCLGTMSRHGDPYRDTELESAVPRAPSLSRPHPSHVRIPAMEFNETPRFWYPCVSCDAWSTFTLRLSRFDRRNAGKISLFVSLSLFSISLSDSSFSPFFALPSLFFSFFPYPPVLPYLVCSILISFHFFPFSLSFHFLFSHFLFSSFFSFLLLLSSPTRMDQVGETSPQFPPWPLVITMFFFLIFFIFFFPFITSCNTWLNLSHLFQMHHMTHAIFHFPSVPCGITWSCHVSLDTGCFEKREILPISESDEIRWGI